MSEAASPWPTSASKPKSTTPAQNPPPPQATILMSPPQRFSVKSKPSVRTAKRADFKAVPNKHSARKKNNARTRARGFPDRRGFGHSGLGIVAKTEAHLYQKKIREQQALEPEGTFKPKISTYSANLQRRVPIYERLFDEGKKKRARQASKEETPPSIEGWPQAIPPSSFPSQSRGTTCHQRS